MVLIIIIGLFGLNSAAGFYVWAVLPVPHRLARHKMPSRTQSPLRKVTAFGECMPGRRGGFFARTVRRWWAGIQTAGVSLPKAWQVV